LKKKNPVYTWVYLYSGEDARDLWLQEISVRPPRWPPSHVYRPLGFHKGTRLDGWSTCWPFSHNA
jgi:hypothetical protein